MKYNKKLWHKFIRKRLYSFDLIHIVDNNEQKVLRFIRGINCTGYKSDDGPQVSIPDVCSITNYQIYNKLSKLNWEEAFIKSREICKNHSNKFKLKCCFIIKELR